MKLAHPDKKYQIKITDHFLDKLYGQIGVTAVERSIEGLPIFKRLHNISQLGLTNWIFPCALHTRYIHSLGVMHMAYNMALHINKNHGTFFTEDDLQIIRLAGLLHDIGHYPLSHNIEMAYEIRSASNLFTKGGKNVASELHDLIGCPRFLFPQEDINGTKQDKAEAHEGSTLVASDPLIKKLDGSSGFHHEAIGKNIITNNQQIHDCVRDNFVVIYDENAPGKKAINPAFRPLNYDGEELDPDKITNALLTTIAEMISGNFQRAFNNCDYSYQQKYSAMLQLIHSELDADNLDYLLRDGTFSGTNYGMIDIEVLLNSLTVQEIELDYKEAMTSNPQNKDCAPHFYLIGITKKGIGSVEQFFHNKYLAYNQMIHNKYVSILESMVLHWAVNSLTKDQVYGIKEDIKATDGLLALSKSKKTEEKLLQFNDAYVFQEFYKNYSALLDLSEKKVSKPNALNKAILSRLTNFTAFDLDEAPSEEIVVGLNKRDVRKRMEKTLLFKQFNGVYDCFKEKTLSEYYENDETIKLFAYRFEDYVMTKQVPLNIFYENAIRETDNETIQLKKHFYRLANGVPILDGATDGVRYHLEIKNKRVKGIPKLIVESDASILRKTYEQQVVSLRRYKICEFGVKKSESI